MASASQTADGARPLTRGMRGILVLAGVLVLLAGIQLFAFPLRTDEWFAWTINPPMTAVFLGASYWAAAALEFTAATRWRWADARIAVPGVLLFTTLTLVVTLVHLDRFHLGDENALATRAVTWVWIAIYAGVPVLMGLLWLAQSRLPGADGQRSMPLPKAVRATLVAQAVVLLPLGTALLIVPAQTSALWPWELTPLTARAIGAWLVGLGVVAAQAVREADVDRIRPAAVASLAFVVLQATALLRHGDDLDPGLPMVLYLLIIASFAITSATAFRRTSGRQAR